MQDSGRKERNMQDENNGQYVRYLIREWKVLCPFSLYLPTNLEIVAYDKARVFIEVASAPSSATTITNKLEP